MNGELPVVNPSSSVEELVFDHLLRRGRRAVLVVDDDRLLGIVSISDVKEVPRDAWGSTRVQGIMTAVPLKTVSPRTEAARALGLLVETSHDQLPVIEGGRPIGLLSRADILRFFQLRLELDLPQKKAA